MSFAATHLAEHPLPPGILGALGLHGYQLLVEVAGVGAGRLGSHAFLLVAPDRDAGLPDAATQLSLHHARLREEAENAAFAQLAAQLGYLRLSGYRLVLERSGLRSRISLVDPGSGRIALRIPERHPGRLFGASATVASLLAAARALPRPEAPPDPTDPELMRQVLLALALQDDELTGEQAVEAADRAVRMLCDGEASDPPAALAAAKVPRPPEVADH